MFFDFYKPVNEAKMGERSSERPKGCEMEEHVEALPIVFHNLSWYHRNYSNR